MKDLSIPSEFRRFPKQWKVMRFLEVISDETGGNPKVLTSDYLDSGTLPVIDQGNSPIAGYVNDVSLKCKAKLPCILFGDHTKNFKFVDHHFALGADGVKVLIPSANLDPKFAFHYLKQVRLPDNAGYSRHFKFLKEAYIPLPPLPEQKRIAAILDKVDSIRRKRQEAVRLTEELLRSVFLDMFGDPVTNPKGWKKVTVRDLVTEVKYGTSDKASYEGKYPVLRMNNITYSGCWNFADLKRIDIPENEIPKYLVRKGDILFNRTNSKELVGKTAVYRRDDPMAYAGYLIRVRPNQHNNSEYIAAYLNSKHGKTILESMCKNIVGMANINAQELQEIEILQPPVELQNQYAALVQSVEGAKDKLITAADVTETFFNSILQRAFKGKL